MSDERPRDINELTSPETARKPISFGTILAAVGVVVFLIFIFQNMDNSRFQVLFWEVTVPVWLLSVIIFILGWVVGWYSKTRKVRAKRKAAKNA